MKKIFEDINRWFYDMTRVFCNEWKLVGKDIGVMLFFVALPLMYPITYTLIYNPEVVERLKSVEKPDDLLEIEVDP